MNTAVNTQLAFGKLKMTIISELVANSSDIDHPISI